MSEPFNYNYDAATHPKTGVVEVVAVPGCLFNGVQVCLSCPNSRDLKKLKIMAGRFRKWYLEQAKRGIVIPSTVGRPVKLN